MDIVIVELNKVTERLAAVEIALDRLTQQKLIKDWYTTIEVAKLLDKVEFTVREWCRLGRIKAGKRRSGRGRYQSWAISHEEVLRIQREGLLPIRATSDHTFKPYTRR